MSRMRMWMIVVLGVALGVGVISGRAFIVGGSSNNIEHDVVTLAHSDQTAAELWPIFVNRPDGPPRVDTGRVDELGRPVTVSCASCHSSLSPDYDRRSAEVPPMQFHQGLAFNHGELSCMACHNPNNYNTLRLADGAAVPYPDVMTMCAQCHAPQARDFAHGAHGGMTGHWDRARGAQFRKNCIDCHDPHAPQMPLMTPTFKPIDRYLEPSVSGERDH